MTAKESTDQAFEKLLTVLCNAAYTAGASGGHTGRTEMIAVNKAIVECWNDKLAEVEQLKADLADVRAAYIPENQGVPDEPAACPPYDKKLNDSMEAIGKVLQEELASEGFGNRGLANCMGMAERIWRAVNPRLSVETLAALPVYEFDRYRDGRLMAEGVQITKQPTLQHAVAAAIAMYPSTDSFRLRSINGVAVSEKEQRS